MTTEIDRIVGVLQSALEGASSVQKTVKDYIKTGMEASHSNYTVANGVGTVIAVFKGNSEGQLNAAIKSGEINTEREILAFRKKVNNIINDVSRICRDMLGYSIVNHKRSKGIFHYMAIPTVGKPAKAAPTPSAAVTSTTFPTSVLFDPAIHVVRPKTIKEMGELIQESGDGIKDAYYWPNWSIEKFLEVSSFNSYSKEEIAKVLIQMIKEERNQKAKAEAA